MSSFNEAARRARLLGWAVPAWVVLGACSDPGGAVGGDWAGTITDSAGVAVVSNPMEGIWDDRTRWTLAEELRIGTSGGDADYQFGQITGIAELPDGRIAVMDGQGQELRVYSAEGEYLARVGGPGSGPGEFALGAGPVLVGPGDSIYVPDAQNQRMNKFTPTLEPAGSSPLDFTMGIPLAWQDTPSGRIVNQIRPLGIPGQPAADSSDLIVERGSSGAITDTLLTFPSGRTFLLRDGVPDFTFFSPEPTWTLTTSGSLAFGVNDRYRFRVFEDGELVRIFERASTVEPVSEADQGMIRDAMVRIWEDFGLAGPQLAIMRDAIGFADSYPAYALVRGGPEGTIWVQHLQTPTDLTAEQRADFNPTLGFGGRTWDVFDAEGRYLGEMRMPERYQPLRMNDDRIYGIWQDELDVQYVLILRVIPTAPNP